MDNNEEKKPNAFKRLFNRICRKKVEVKEMTSNYVSVSEFEGGPAHFKTEMEEAYLFDFKNYSSGYIGSSRDVMDDLDDDVEARKERRKAEREAQNRKIEVKPKYVLNELETVPTPFSLNELDGKLQILRDKEELINQHYAKRELKGLIERLENRKKYVDNKEFFDNYQNTTDEAIDKLLDKYKLVMKTSDIFIPEFPDEAIVTMKAYSDKCVELFGQKPVYYVIAEESKFRKSYEKRDPILLVQSPFGFYWQILGAWDEEMILLGEL